MTSRDELRRTGAEMREKLGFPTNSDDNELAPGLNRLAEEMVWGSVWSRPGLILEDRMLAALSASYPLVLPRLKSKKRTGSRAIGDLVSGKSLIG